MLSIIVKIYLQELNLGVRPPLNRTIKNDFEYLAISTMGIPA